MPPSFLHLVYQIQPPLFFLSIILGLLSLTKFSIFLLYHAYVYFLRRPKHLKSLYGQWALVTGCTDGIGRSIAFELARNGLNLLLVGRNPEKLQTVSASIEESYHQVSIKNVVIDLSGDVKAGMRRLEREIEGLDLGVVVNNAGMANTNAEFFHEVPMEKWMEMIRVNLESPTEMTRVVLKGMMERKRGAIVNIGSGSSVAIPSYPLYDVYASTKAYISQFSKSLHVEYKNKGIDIQCQVPMYVDTKMIQGALSVEQRNTLFVATANGYAQAAVRWIGFDAECVPYFLHFVECCLIYLVPDFVLRNKMWNENMAQRKIK